MPKYLQTKMIETYLHKIDPENIPKITNITDTEKINDLTI